MKEKTTDEKIVEIVKFALAENDGPKLIKLSEILERRGRFANLLKEILQS